MVVTIAKSFAYALFFILALIYFTPKVATYYFLEQELKEYAIVISSEVLDDRGFSLNIQNANISAKGIPSAKVETIDITIFGIYNTMDITNIELSSVASALVPTKIHNIDMRYSIFNPLNLNAYAKGEFGEASVIFEISSGMLHIELTPSQLMLKNYKQTLQNLKKSQQGVYTYDKIIKL